MNIFTKSTLLAATLLAGAASAQAYTLVKPNPAEVQRVSEIGTVHLVWSEWYAEEDADPTKEVTILDANGTVVASTLPELSWDDFSTYDLHFSPAVTTLGEYTMVVPANIAPDNTNPEYRISYVVEEKAPVVPCVPTKVTPTPGTDVIQGDYDGFTSINLQFGNDAWLEINESQLQLKDQSGNKVQMVVSGTYTKDNPMLQYFPNPVVLLNFNDDGQLASGTYTLTIPAGAIKSDNGQLEETLTYTWNYTKTRAEADPTPLEILSIELGTSTATGGFDDNHIALYNWNGDGTPIQDGAPIAKFSGKDKTVSALRITLNHGAKTRCLAYELYDDNAGEIIYNSNALKLEDDSFLISWPYDINLYEGNTYKLNLNAYSSFNYMTHVEFGQGATFNITGAQAPFRYSSAVLAVVSPDPEITVISSLEMNKVTFVYSEPVKITRSDFIVGQGFSSPIEAVSRDGGEYDRVWYVTIPDNALNSRVACDISMAAVGQDGLVVAGESGFEETACTMVSYDLTLCQPRILLGQTDSHRPGLEIFTVSAERNYAINESYMGYPVIKNAKGEVVANIDEEYAEEYIPEWDWTDYSPYKVLRTSGGSEPDPLELEFRMVPAITEPGNYTLCFPKWSFALGTQFDGCSSIAQEFPFTVVPFAEVTYSVDHHTVTLPAVESGKKHTLPISVADNWKLESLTLNGEDVTDQVKDGVYTTPALNERADLAATFAFDGAMALPSSADEIVTDLNLRGWSQDGKLYVAGLKEGQTLNVYTLGGARMVSFAVSAETAEITVPAGEAYIVTVSEGNQTVALKLVCK